MNVSPKQDLCVAFVTHQVLTIASRFILPNGSKSIYLSISVDRLNHISQKAIMKSAKEKVKIILSKFKGSIDFSVKVIVASH